MAHHVTEVFTPTTAARLTFVERASVNARLVNALRTPGTQVVVFGRSGCGKTTLLTNKLHQVYESEVTTRCTGTTTFEALLLDAFDRISPFVEKAQTSKTGWKLTATVEAAFKAIKSTMTGEVSAEDSWTSERALPPQLTPQFLARLLGQMEACWVVEDFHKVGDEERKKLSQVMKLFMDAAQDYPRVKIVAIGAVATARQVVECDPEMWNRVAEIEVPLMTSSELDEIMDKGSSALNIRITDSARDSIKRFSNGLPSVCHQLCLNMCFNEGIELTVPNTTEFGSEDLSSAVRAWLSDSADSLKRAYDTAVRAKRIRTFDNCRLIINAIAHFGPEGATHPMILKQVRRSKPQYPPANLTQYLSHLCSAERGSILLKDDASGRYSFSLPMMHAYARVRAEAVVDQSHAVNLDTLDLAELLRRLIKKDKQLKKLFTEEA